MDSAPPQSRLPTGYGRGNAPANQGPRLTQLEATCLDMVRAQIWPSKQRTHDATKIPIATLGRSPFREVRDAACRLFCQRYPNHPQSVREAKRQARKRPLPQVQPTEGELERAIKQCRKLADGIRERDAIIEKLRTDIIELKQKLGAMESSAHPPRQPRS